MVVEARLDDYFGWDELKHLTVYCAAGIFVWSLIGTMLVFWCMCMCDFLVITWHPVMVVIVMRFEPSEILSSEFL